MSIRGKLRWMGILPVVVFLLLTGHALVIQREGDRMMHRSRQMDEILKLSSQWAVITYELASHDRKRPDEQWHTLQQRIAELLTALSGPVADPDERYLLDEMHARVTSVKQRHDEFHALPDVNRHPEMRQYQEMLIRRMRIEVQSLAPLVEKLHDLHNAALMRLLAWQGRLNIILQLMLALIVGLTSGMLVRAITRSLSVLHQGILSLGRGDLTSRIELDSRDELGEVAATLNHMREQLGEITVSRDVLQEKEREARGIIQTALDGFWITDLHGRILDVNDAYCQLSGYTRDELLTMSIAQLEAKESPEEVARHLANLHRNGHDRFESCHRCKDGALLELEISVRCMDMRGGLLIAFLHDITARKRDQRHLAETLEFNRRIIQEAPAGVVVFHRDGPTVLANHAAVRILGAASQEELLSLNFHQLESWRISGMYVVAMDALQGWHPRRLEAFVHTRFGSSVWLDSQFVPLTLNDQPHLMVIFTDTTESNQAREAMARARRLAEEASLAKSDFLANMSHEIRTPMNAILGMADLLWESALTPEQRKCVQISRSSGETLMGIINDILDFSKIEAGCLDLEEIDFRLEEEVETVCEIMAPRAREKGLELAWRIAADLPRSVRGDSVRLRQILINFLSNALKFTDQGEVELTVNRLPAPATGGEEKALLLEVAVRDTGIGIPRHRLTNIFESFTQGDRSTTRRYGGTGLGLAIVKRLAERMGGNIAVESVPGQGSLFRVTLQLREGVEQHAPLPAPDLSGKRILVVDDTEANRLMLCQILLPLGAGVTEAVDGQTALLLMERARERREPFHLLLLDERMPGLDGLRVVECWKAAGYPGTPILMLTSDYRESHKQRCAELGVHHYLVKPARRVDLHAVIAAALGLEPSAVLTPVVDPLAALCVDTPLRILLAEDTIENRLVVQGYFKRTAYHLDLAENGAIALEKLKSATYDLVLMDIHMPIMDGYAATRAWRAWEREQARHPVYMIALTANAMQEDIQRSLEAGCDAHLTKPIRRKTLLEAIARVTVGLASDRKVV
ncbi:MAG: response regulator [Magnetococcales bacterium]|nr:response regulator [Magnetococcales bacterium]